MVLKTKDSVCRRDVYFTPQKVINRSLLTKTQHLDLISKPKRYNAHRNRTSDDTGTMWRYFIKQFFEIADNNVTQVKKTKLTKLLHSKNPKLCSTKTQSDLCNFIRNLDPDCGSSEWKREFSKTLSSLIFSNVVEVLSGEKTSTQKKSAEMILKKINDVVDGRESTSPDGFSRGVQKFVADMLSPWLGKSVADVCGNAGGKNHGLEMVQSDDEFLEGESGRFQRKRDSVKTSTKTKGDKKKSTGKNRKTYGQNNPVSLRPKIGTRKKIGRSDNATAEKLKRHAADARKRGFDIGGEYSEKKDGLINLNDENSGGKSIATRISAVDRELEKGSAAIKVDGERASLEKVVKKRKRSVVGERTKGKKLLKNLEIKNKKITSKSRDKVTADSRRTGQTEVQEESGDFGAGLNVEIETDSKTGRKNVRRSAVGERTKGKKLLKNLKIKNKKITSNSRDKATADGKRTGQTEVLEESGDLGADVNVEIETDSKTGRKNVRRSAVGDRTKGKKLLKNLKIKNKKITSDSRDKTSADGKRMGQTEVLEESGDLGADVNVEIETDSKTGRKKVKSVKPGDKDPSKTLNPKKNEKRRQSIVSGSRQDKQHVEVEDKGEWNLVEKDEGSGPCVERPEGYSGSSSCVEEEWSQDDERVTSPDKTRRPKTFGNETVKRNSEKGSTPGAAAVGGLDGGSGANVYERDETTTPPPRPRGQDAGHAYTDGAGYTSGGPRKDDHRSRRSSESRDDAEQANAGGVGYTSGAQRQDGHRSQRTKISRGADDANTAGHTSGGPQEDDNRSRRTKISRGADDANTAGVGYTSGRPQEDDPGSRKSRESIDLDQVNAGGAGYTSGKSQKDDYRSRRPSESLREADQTNSASASYTADRPQKDSHHSRRSRESRDADQMSAVGVGHTSGAPRQDGHRSQWTKISRGADDANTAGAGYTSGRPQEDDPGSRKSRESIDLDQVNAGGAGYTSGKSQKRDYRSRRPSESREADQTNSASARYTADRPQKDSHHSRRSMESQDADQMSAVGVGYTFDGSREDDYRSLRSRESRDAYQTNAADTGYTPDGSWKDNYHSRQSRESRDTNQADDLKLCGHIDDYRCSHDEKSVSEVVSSTQQNIKDDMNEFFNRIMTANDNTSIHGIRLENSRKNCAKLFANKTRTLMDKKTKYETSTGDKTYLRHRINFRVCKNDCKDHDKDGKLLPPCADRTFTLNPKRRAIQIVKPITRLETNFFEDFRKCLNNKKQ